MEFSYAYFLVRILIIPLTIKSSYCKYTCILGRWYIDLGFLGKENVAEIILFIILIFSDGLNYFKRRYWGVFEARILLNE